MSEELRNEELNGTNNVENETNQNNESISWEEKYKELMAENAKLKKATDKATSEAAAFKKQLREKQTADEIALQEKAEKDLEREEKFNQLLRENTINKSEKNFILLGYSEEQANQAATAQFDGDFETLFKLQAEVQKNLIKSKEAEWLKSRPLVNTGGGSKNDDDPFLKGFNF